MHDSSNYLISRFPHWPGVHLKPRCGSLRSYPWSPSRSRRDTPPQSSSNRRHVPSHHILATPLSIDNALRRCLYWLSTNKISKVHVPVYYRLCACVRGGWVRSDPVKSCTSVAIETSVWWAGEQGYRSVSSAASVDSSSTGEWLTCVVVRSLATHCMESTFVRILQHFLPLGQVTTPGIFIWEGCSPEALRTKYPRNWSSFQTLFQTFTAKTIIKRENFRTLDPLSLDQSDSRLGGSTRHFAGLSPSPCLVIGLYGSLFCDDYWYRGLFVQLNFIIYFNI